MIILNIFGLLAFCFINCAPTAQQWSSNIQSPKVLKSIQIGDQVIIVLKDKHEYEGTIIKQTENQIILQISRPDSIKGCSNKYF